MIPLPSHPLIPTFPVNAHTHHSSCFLARPCQNIFLLILRGLLRLCMQHAFPLLFLIHAVIYLHTSFTSLRSDRTHCIFILFSFKAIFTTARGRYLFESNCFLAAFTPLHCSNTSLYSLLHRISLIACGKPTTTHETHHECWICSMLLTIPSLMS